MLVMLLASLSAEGELGVKTAILKILFNLIAVYFRCLLLCCELTYMSEMIALFEKSAYCLVSSFIS